MSCSPVEGALGVVDVVAAPGGVGRPDTTVAEAEPGRARVQHIGAVGAGPALAVLPHLGAGTERLALRHPLQIVPPGEVQELGRLRRDRERHHDLVQRIRLGGQVGHRRPGPEQAAGQQLQHEPQLEAARVVDGQDLHSPRA
jgi:hypothetical protein